MSPAQIKVTIELPYGAHTLLLRLDSSQTRFIKTALADLPVEERGTVLESIAARLPSGGRISDAQLAAAVRAMLNR